MRFPFNVTSPLILYFSSAGVGVGAGVGEGVVPSTFSSLADPPPHPTTSKIIDSKEINFLVTTMIQN